MSKKYIISGHDYLEKEVKPHSETASKIYLPADWQGKKVAVIKLEE